MGQVGVLKLSLAPPQGGMFLSVGHRGLVMAWVVAVCGMPGSGKGEFAAVLSQAGVPVVSMGDMIRAEVRAQGLVEEPHIFGEVAAALRAEHGEDVLAVRLCERVDELLETHEMVLIEGLRGTAEDAVFSARWGNTYLTVAIEADAELRFSRIVQRGRSEDGDRAAFEARNERERGWGLEHLIAEANNAIHNDVELDEFQARCRVWLDALRARHTA